MSEVNVSVIIPVYNAEVYLDKCIQSLLSQSMKNIEFIFIDDGSTDKSLKIIQSYTDERIIVYSKQNGGVSSARNYGISMASGEYIGFVDPDDWIESDMYEKMYEKCKNDNLDLIICSVIKSFPNNTEVEILDILTDTILYTSQLEVQEYKLFCGSVWKGLYRKKIIDEQDLFFDESLKMSEDVLFNLHFLPFTNKIMYLNDAYYHYYQNYKSVVNNYNPSLLDEVIKSKEKIIDFLKIDINKPLNSQLEELYNEEFIFVILQVIMNEFKPSNTISLYKKIWNIKQIVKNDYIRSFLSNIVFEENSFRFNVIYYLLLKKLYFCLAILAYHLNKKIKVKFL